MRAPVGQCDIYRLRDPRDLLVCYVGQSTNCGQRVQRHMTVYEISRPIDAWMAGLYSMKRPPILDVIERVAWEDRIDYENFWIAEYVSRGMPLLNLRPNRHSWRLFRPFTHEEMTALELGVHPKEIF